MIQVDPAVIYNKFFFYRESCEAAFRANVAKIEEERKKFESFPWWKRWWLGGVDAHMWEFCWELPHQKDCSSLYLVEATYKDLRTACEYALAHRAKIELPSEYWHVLGWPDE